MSQPFSPEFLAEKALRNFLQQYVTPGYILNWYLSDSNTTRERPCIAIITQTCEEQQLGQAVRGQWQTGVFKAEVAIDLEEKAYHIDDKRMSVTFAEIRSPFYQSESLVGATGLLTSAIPEPFHVHYCFVKKSEQVMVEEFQLSRKLSLIHI